MAVKTNKKLAKVDEENRRLSADKQAQEEYWLEKKALYDYNTDISVAKREGREEGVLAVAKELLRMKFNIKDIEKATGLTEKEIMKLKAV